MFANHAHHSSTIAAETMAALEAVAEAERFRAHLPELREVLDTHGDYDAQLRKTKALHLSDSKSLYDLIHDRGTVPAERRRLLDVEALREMQLQNAESRLISMKQMLADRSPRGMRAGLEHKGCTCEG